MFVHYLHPQSLLHGLFSGLFLVPRALFKSSSVCRGASFSWTRCSKQSQRLFQQHVNSHQLPCRSFLCVSCKPMVNVTQLPNHFSLASPAFLRTVPSAVLRAALLTADLATLLHPIRQRNVFPCVTVKQCEGICLIMPPHLRQKPYFVLNIVFQRDQGSPTDLPLQRKYTHRSLPQWHLLLAFYTPSDNQQIALVPSSSAGSFLVQGTAQKCGIVMAQRGLEPFLDPVVESQKTELQDYVCLFQ